VNRQMSPEGRLALQGHESCVLHPYPDANGASIGWGHFITPGDPWYADVQAVLSRGLVGTSLRDALALIVTITQTQADAMLTHDLIRYEACINGCVTAPITQPQFDSLVDFSYNEGTAALPRSTLLKYLNAGNYGMAADHFLEWDKDIRNGVLSDDPVLLARRKAERALFLSELPPEPEG
jgi:GH24 family phage-related lysozyme (muramidase)